MSYESNPKPIRTFKDLTSWKESHELVIEIYTVTINFPSKEQFGLTNQLRRAAVSIVSNIAEGFGRRSTADRIRFYDMARASLHEVQAQLLVAKDVGFLPAEKFCSLEEMTIVCHKLLTGLIIKQNRVTRDSYLISLNSYLRKDFMVDKKHNLTSGVVGRFTRG